MMALSLRCFIILVVFSTFHCDSTLDERLIDSIVSDTPPNFSMGVISSRLVVLIFPPYLSGNFPANQRESFVFDVPLSSLNWTKKRLLLHGAEPLKQKWPALANELEEVTKALTNSKETIFRCIFTTHSNESYHFINCAVGFQGNVWIQFNLANKQVNHYRKTLYCNSTAGFISTSDSSKPTFYLSSHSGGLMSEHSLDHPFVELTKTGRQIRFCPGESSVYLNNSSCKKEEDNPVHLRTGFISGRQCLFVGTKGTVWMTSKSDFADNKEASPILLEAVSAKNFFLSQTDMVNDEQRNAIVKGFFIIIVMFIVLLFAVLAVVLLIKPRLRPMSFQMLKTHRGKIPDSMELKKKLKRTLQNRYRSSTLSSEMSKSKTKRKSFKSFLSLTAL